MQLLDKSGYAAQFVSIRLRVRLWPSGWWVVLGRDVDGGRLYGLARFD